jgi:hypothetical protein
VSGTATLAVPAGWRAEPKAIPFTIPRAGDESVVQFRIVPSAKPSVVEARVTAGIAGASTDVGVQLVNYPHIPAQVVISPARVTLTRTDVTTLARNVGYVMGAGDVVPDALRQLGCSVTLLSADHLASADLSHFDAIVTGVRAYNVRRDLRANHHRLMEYVRNGGTMVVQYNVLEGGFMRGDTAALDNIGPYPIKIGRDRVSVEQAPVTVLTPDHPVLSRANKITPADFEGWVQERGLYFASNWDSKYETLLASSDPGEKPLPGGLLYTRFGKGVYIFTAYSWFRQLPAGVPGAYRIFANLLSAGKAQ